MDFFQSFGLVFTLAPSLVMTLLFDFLGSAFAEHELSLPFVRLGRP